MRSAAFADYPKGAEEWVPPLAATGVSAAFFFHGFDNAVGQSLYCLLTSIILLALLWMVRSPGVAIQGVRLPVLLFGCGLAWLVMVHVLRQYLFYDQSDLPLAPDMFLAKYLSIVGGLWMFLIGILAGSLRRFRNLTIGWLLALLTVHCLVGMALGLVPELEIAGPMMKDNRLLGLVGNANVTASLTGAAVILAMGGILAFFPGGQERAISRRGQVGLVAYGFALIVNGVGLVLTASRFPALVTVLGLILLLWSQRSVSRAFLRQMMPFALCAMAILILAQFFFSGLLFERFSDLPRQAMQRGELWMRFLDMAMAAPFTGYGPGAFPSVNSYFLRTTPVTGEIWTINSPHNIFLQLWFVGGLPYLACMLGGTVLVMRSIYRKAAMCSAPAGYVAIIVAAMIIYLCGMVDIVLDVPASAGLALFLTGFATAGRGDYRAFSRKA